jgi:ornithine carbamoyltransferase
MHVTVAHPPGYELAGHIIDRAASWCAAGGRSFEITTDQRGACQAGDVVYVKSWGSAGLYGNAEEQSESFRRYADWMVTPAHLATDAILMHCLPVRRNLVIADAALDDPRCVVVDQAENRMWAQAAILQDLLAPGLDGQTLKTRQRSEHAPSA